MEDAIRKLIDTYEQLLHDHKIPIDNTNREQIRLGGYDAALIRVIHDLKSALFNCKFDPEKDKDKYFE